MSAGLEDVATVVVAALGLASSRTSSSCRLSSSSPSSSSCNADRRGHGEVARGVGGARGAPHGGTRWGPGERSTREAPISNRRPWCAAGVHSVSGRRAYRTRSLASDIGACESSRNKRTVPGDRDGHGTEGEKERQSETEASVGACGHVAGENGREKQVRLVRFDRRAQEDLGTRRAGSADGTRRRRWCAKGVVCGEQVSTSAARP